MITHRNYVLLLWIACIVSAFAVIPFTHAVALFTNQPLEIITPAFLLGLTFEGIIVYGLLIYFGMKFAHKLGIRFLLLDKNADLKNDLFKTGLLAGIFCACAMLMVDALLPASLFSLHALAKSIPPVAGLLGALFGVINQQVILSLFYISGIALLLKRLLKNMDMSIIMGISIALSALLFGLAHVPLFVQSITLETPLMISRILILNAISGTTFGLLFWRKGFETAVFAHMIVDFML